jgi:pyruvate dehydrogenase E2 component (dihydrolipoamide acetyltransferase)
VAESKTIALPDVGDFTDIEIIEILIAVGDQVAKEQSIIVLESDKATMEIPSPFDGTIEAISVSVGDRINEGDAIASISTSAAAAEPAEKAAPAPEPTAPAVEAPVAADAPASEAAAPAQKSDVTPGKPLRPHPGATVSSSNSAGATIHASPSIRRYARELGVRLEQVIGSGPKGRIVKADVKAFIKSSMTAGGRRWNSGQQRARDRSLQVWRNRNHSAEQNQEDIRRAFASQLGNGAACHPVRRSRHHRARSFPQVAGQRG